MGFLSGLLSGFLFGLGKKTSRADNNVKLEQEMQRYGLFEDEKKLVRSGKYDPWSFEEEELDEDDYYHDDN